MKIAPISGFSGSQTYIRPMNFSVDNTSDVSAGFAESIRRTAGKYSVGASKPVVYPDSSAVSKGPGKGSAEARQIEAHFNRIASDHYGETVGYGPRGQALGYEAEGRVFDVYI